MFEFLFGKKSPERLPDRVWLNAEAKWTGLRAEVEKLRQEGSAVLLAAFFPQTLAAVEKAVPGCKRLSGALWPEQVLRSSAPGLWLWSPSPPHQGASTASAAEGRLAVLVAEHHLVPEPDAALLSCFAGWPGKITARFYSDLDEPLLSLFSSQALKPLLERLGMNADEPIESSMVDNSIASAQKRTSRLAVSSHPASSPQAWLAANLPRQAS